MAAMLLVTGCTTTHYRESADRETYQIIREKTPRVPNMDTAFTIEQEELPRSLSRILRWGTPRRSRSAPTRFRLKTRWLSL